MAVLRRLARGLHRRLVFARAMRRFLAAPEACAVPGHPVLRDLVRGWGNPDWSALDEYLAGCIAEALAADGPVLECGSGLSTILVGAVLDRRGRDHWALEHQPTWGDRVARRLRRWGGHRTRLLVAPLKDYGEFTWYAPPQDVLPEHFSLVICDGPPGDTPGGRYGLLPVMAPRLREGSVVLLDDVGRGPEAEVVRRWSAERGGAVERRGEVKPWARWVVGSSPGA